MEAMTEHPGNDQEAAADKGRQQLLTFSVVVTAELAEVTASYRHRNGEPLFDLGSP